MKKGCTTHSTRHIHAWQTAHAPKPGWHYRIPHPCPCTGKARVVASSALPKRCIKNTRYVPSTAFEQKTSTLKKHMIRTYWKEIRTGKKKEDMTKKWKKRALLPWLELVQSCPHTQTCTHQALRTGGLWFSFCTPEYLFEQEKHRITHGTCTQRANLGW